MKQAERLLFSALEAGKGGLSLDEYERMVQMESKKETTNNEAVDVEEPARARYLVDKKVFKIGRDSELAERIRNSSKSKYTVIKEYLIEKFGDTVFTLSDGKKAIMDNNDAEKLKYNADALRIAELAELKNLVEKAEYIGDPQNVQHPKFDAFSYYKIKISYEGNEFDIVINVGRAKNDKTYHIYAITNYNEKGAVGLLKNNPSSPVGNWIKDGSSTTIIRENSEKSIENTKKIEKRFSLDGEQGKPDYVTSLRKYLHRLNISDETKADMVEAFGEKRTRVLLNVWENTDGKEKGVDIPTAHKQLWKDGFRSLKRQTNAKKPMYEHRLS